MINVCAKYGDTIILLESFETKEEAEEFMKYDYVLNYADEFEDGEDEIISSNEMFLEDEIPFFEKVNNTLGFTCKLDELPF